MSHVESDYATLLRRLMAGPNALGRRVTIRELAGATHKHYEHIRKLLAGEPVVSRELNQRIAKYLGGDEELLWRAAQHEKLRRRFSADVVAQFDVPQDAGFRRLAVLWPSLDAGARQSLIRMAEKLVESRPR